MTQASRNTPTPWHFGNTADDQKMILGANDRYVASIQIWQTPRVMGLHDEAEREANAELIVKAVNAHRELVKALEECAKARTPGQARCIAINALTRHHQGEKA